MSAWRRSSDSPPSADAPSGSGSGNASDKDSSLAGMGTGCGIDYREQKRFRARALARGAALVALARDRAAGARQTTAMLDNRGLRLGELLRAFPLSSRANGREHEAF